MVRNLKKRDFDCRSRCRFVEPYFQSGFYGIDLALVIGGEEGIEEARKGGM
jgi:hypothetical protein